MTKPVTSDDPHFPFSVVVHFVGGAETLVLNFANSAERNAAFELFRDGIKTIPNSVIEYEGLVISPRQITYVQKTQR